MGLTTISEGLFINELRSDWTKLPTCLSELEILLTVTMCRFVSGISGVFSSLNILDYVCLTWHNVTKKKKSHW